MTANELAAHFEVSKRTILRDINTLTEAGIPIYTTQGKGGGIFIQDRFTLNKTFISEDEQKQILFSLQSMSATEFIETDQILGRLQSLFDMPRQEWIEVDFSRWGNSTIDGAKFETLKNAIINEAAMSFDYASAHGESKNRKVYPLKLSFKSKAWYLQAFCLRRKDYRIFKITRMRNMTVLDERFNSKDYEVPRVEPTDASSLCLIDMKLLVLPHAIYRMYDEFTEEDITINRDGAFEVRVYAPHDQWVYDYILSFGSAIEVLEPQYVRDELLIQAEKIKNKYLPKT